MIFRASFEQKDILETIKNGSENVSVFAPAGSGKTSTTLYTIDSLSTNLKILYLVFNQNMKKEFEQKINSPFSIFKNINKQNVEILTLFGYIRKVLSEKIKDITFDYKNGDITAKHFETIIKKTISPSYISTQKTAYTVESLNTYIKTFLQGTQSLEDFLKEDKSFFYTSPDTIEELKNVLYNKGVDISNLTEREQQSAVRELFDEVLKQIFYNGALNNDMPHSVYYKYAYENYKNENLFDGYDLIYMDEAQDIDPIIVALVETSKIKTIKLGDEFQQINRFRGTISSLDDGKSTQKFLTTSFRLSPYLALLTTAYLHQQSSRIGIDITVPNIVGFKRGDKKLSQEKPKELALDEFIDDTVKKIEDIDILKNDTYIEIAEMNRRIDNAIIKGCKGNFKKAVSAFNKDRDYMSFLKDVHNLTTLYREGDNQEFKLFDIEEESILKRDKTESIQLLQQEIQREDKYGAIHTELYNIAKSFNFKLSKKEKIELLGDDYALLSRNNDKLIDNFIRFLKKIPNEPLSDFPLFQIKINSTFTDKFKAIESGNLSALSIRDIAIWKRALGELFIKDFSMSVNDILEELSKKIFPSLDKVIDTLIRMPQKAESLSKIRCISIDGKTLSLSDFGINGTHINSKVSNAVATAKRKLKKEEVCGRDIVENRILKSYSDFIKPSALLQKFFTIDAIEFTTNKMLINFYKMAQAQDIIKLNQNIDIVKNNGVANVNFFTVHGSKGLEFDNVFVSNDLYMPREDMDKMQEKDEFNLAYVSITRAKSTVHFEMGSEIYEQLNDVLENKFSRTYATLDEKIIVKEELSETPSFTFYWFDSMEKKIKEEKIIFYDASSYPSYKNIKIKKTDEGDVKEILFENDFVKQESDISFLKMVNVEKYDNIKEQLQRQEEVNEELRRELEAEAMQLF